MRHVAAHRWADAWAGKLPDDEVAQMDRHAEGCPRCAKARDRITHASSVTFRALRTQTAPELGWDAVRAKVYWSVSTEKRTRVQPRRFRLAWGIAFAGAAVAAAVATGTIGVPRSHEAPKIAAAPPPNAAPPAPVTGLVSRLSGEVMFDGLRRPDAFEHALAAGAVIATGDGRVDVQFGDQSAFALGARSTLELRRFDAESIELVVDGTIDVEVAPRAAGQRFVVLAGDETIEVRGTQFRVTRDDRGVRVSCRHGLVAVRDAGGEVAVGTARGAFVSSGARAGAVHASPLSADELVQLAAGTPVALPLWSDAAQLAKTSSPLEIASATKSDVRVDGVELGAAPLRVRVMPGRHTVEAADRAGRYRRAGWVDVAAAGTARLEVQPVDEPAPTSGVAQRKKELAAGIERARRACTRDLLKSGISGAVVQIEIAVDGGGNINYVNVLDSDLGTSGQSCVLDVLRAVHFAPGPAASWRERISL